MARYRKIDTRIWNDQRFATLFDDAKLVFLFLLTHPHLTSLGAMRATVPGLAAELGWTVERFQAAFNELVKLPVHSDSSSDDHALVEFDDRACFVGLPNFLKYNAPENPNVVKSWEALLDMLPECECKTRLAHRVLCCLKPLGQSFVTVWERVCQTLSEGFGEPFGKGMPNGMPNPEPEQEPKPEPEQDSLSSPDGESEKEPAADSSKSDSEMADEKAGTSPKFSDEDLTLAREMFDGIKAIQPNARPPNLDRWANEMRLLRADGQDRTAEAIRATLAWVRQDQFWKSNILSPAKLREKWDQLQLKRSSQNESRTTSNKPDGLYREANQPGRRTF